MQPGCLSSPSAATVNASQLNQTDKSADAEGLTANGLCFLFHMEKEGKNKNDFHMPSDCLGEIKGYYRSIGAEGIQI